MNRNLTGLYINFYYLPIIFHIFFPELALFIGWYYFLDMEQLETSNELLPQFFTRNNLHSILILYFKIWILLWPGYKKLQKTKISPSTGVIKKRNIRIKTNRCLCVYVGFRNKWERMKAFLDIFPHRKRTQDSPANILIFSPCTCVWRSQFSMGHFITPRNSYLYLYIFILWSCWSCFSTLAHFARIRVDRRLCEQ